MSGDGLVIRGLSAGYGRIQVLRGLDLDAPAGAVTALIGRNGAGKSTTFKALMGLLRGTAGSARFAGVELIGLPAHRVARAGLGWAPEDRRIFTDLTVMENLAVAARPPVDGRAAWTPERLFALFPNLGRMRGRLGGRMSGGEQQMLTMARMLMGNPACLLLDEPSEGLAPVIVEEMARAVQALKAEGLTILLSEQNLHFAAEIADHAAVIETGEIRWRGTMAALHADAEARARWLSV